MKNGLDVVAECETSPPLKRIKVEMTADDDAHLLSTAFENGHDSQLGQRKKRGGRPKTTTEDRALVLLNDPRISAVEPTQVLCRMCGHWIKLFKHIEFSPANWKTHADRCEARTGWSAKVRAEPSKKFTLTIPSLSSLRQQNQQQQASAGTSSAPVADLIKTPSSETLEPEHVESTQPVAAPRINDKAETRRKNTLECDIRIEEFDAHKVLCKMCGSWVRLHNIRTYDLWNWHRHAEKCELKPGNMDPGVLRARYDAEQQQSALTNHDYSLRQRLPEAPLLSPTEPPVSSVRVKRRFSAYGSANHTEGDSLRQEASASVQTPGMPSSSSFRSVSHHALNTNAVGDNATFVKPEPMDLDRDMLHGTGHINIPELPTSAGSSGPKRRRGRTIDERRQALIDDPRTGEVFPHEVWCNMCGKWVKLYRDVQYIESNWIRHAEKCYIRAMASGDPKVQQWTVPKVTGLSYVNDYDESTVTTKSAAPPASPISLVSPVASTSRLSFARASARTPARTRYAIVKVEDEDEDNDDSSVSIPVAGRKASHHRMRDDSTAEDRRNILVEDGRCTEVEPQSVMCLMCNRRVGLHAKKDYSLSNWFKHARSCAKADGNPAQRRPEVPRTTFTASAPPPGASLSLRIAPPRLTLTHSADHEESSLSSRGYTNGEARKAQLLADPRVMDVEPNRIQCRLCEKWLKLNDVMSYAPYNWQKHIERCMERNNVNTDDKPKLSVIVKHDVVSAPAQISRKRFTSQQRYERLQTDKRIKTIEKHRARCALCNKWVKLQANTEYDPHNWYAHINKCEIKVDRVFHPDTDDDMMEVLEASTLNTESFDAGETGSSRILARRQFFVDDADALAVEPHRILCGICKQWIKLRDDKPYIPFNWVKHKGKCERRHGLVRSDSISTPVTISTGGSSSVIKEEPADESPVFVSSAGSLRKSTADAEREAQLRADPRQVGVEPGRVLCGMCNSWIKLNLSNGFLPGNWVRHAARCEKKTQNGKFPDAMRKRDPVQPELTSAEVIDLETEGLDMNIFGFIELGKILSAFEPSISSTEYARTAKKAEENAEAKHVPKNYSVPTLRARASNIATAVSSRMNSPAPVSSSQSVIISGAESSRRAHRSEPQRKADLEGDPRTKVVLTDKILCALCDRWIQMRKDVAYSPQNWLKHAGICEKRHGFVNRVAEEKKPQIKPDSEHSDYEPDEKPALNAVLPFNARRKQRAAMIADVPAPALKPADWTLTPNTVYSSDSDNDADDSLPVTPQLDARPKPIAIEGRKKPGRKPKGEERTLARPSSSFVANEHFAAGVHPSHATPSPYSRDVAYRTEFQAAQASMAQATSVSMYQMMPMGPVHPPLNPSARGAHPTPTKPAPFVVPMTSQILPHLLPRQMQTIPTVPYVAPPPQSSVAAVASPFLASTTPPVPHPASTASNSKASTPGIPDLPTPPPTTNYGRRSSSVVSTPKSKSAQHIHLPTVPSMSRTSSVPAPQPTNPIKPTFNMMPQDPGVLQLAPPTFVRNSPAPVQTLSASASQSSVTPDASHTMDIQVDKDGVLLIHT